MWILMEKQKNDASRDIADFNCVDVVFDENEAIKFINENPNTRTYKYCPYKEEKDISYIYSHG